MRSNAAVYDLAPAERDPREQGRPRVKGARLGSLTEIASNAVFHAVTITSPSGRTRTIDVHEFVCLWYEPLHIRPVEVILSRNTGTTEASTLSARAPTPPAAPGS